VSAAKKIRALRNRGQVLSQRLSASAGGPKWEHEELAALAWALPILDDLVARNAERAEDVHHRHKDAAYARMAAVAVERLAECDLGIAARVLAECEVDDVRRAVLGTIRFHGSPGMSECLSEWAAVR
jgi:hypothetical protein